MPVKALSLLPQPLPVPFCFPNILHVYSTHPQPKPLFFAVPSKSAFPPLPLLTYERRGNSNASLTGILPPTRCHCSAPSSASHLGCELPILHLSQKVLSHFLTFVMAVSSACECLRARTLIFFLLPLAWHPFMRPTKILRSYNVPGSLLGARMQE